VLSYVLIDLLTGRIAADLIDVHFGGTHKQTMGRSESVTADLPINSAPSNWRSETVPYTAAIICLDDDGQTPVWGGIINQRDTSEAASVQLALVTAEDYLDRRYVGDVTYTATAQNLIAQDLVNRFIIPNGIPIRVQIEGGNGVTRDHSWKDTDDKTVLSALQELSGLDGGPEWCIDWERSGSDLSLITPVLRVGDRLGSAPPTGLGPAVQFNLPGNVTKCPFTESYKSGAGANDVMAVSSGSAGARPQSTHHVVTGDNRPKLEYRWTPSTSITDTSTLEAHATRVLAAISTGTQSLALSANRRESAHLGSDWHLGDTVGFDLTSDAWPDGLTGMARVIGWEIDETTVTPIVLVDAASVAWGGTVAPVAGGPILLTATWNGTDNGDGTWTSTAPNDINQGNTFSIVTL
jgi:hypothetical protein